MWHGGVGWRMQPKGGLFHGRACGSGGWSGLFGHLDSPGQWREENGRPFFDGSNYLAEKRTHVRLLVGRVA